MTTSDAIRACRPIAAAALLLAAATARAGGGADARTVHRARLEAAERAAQALAGPRLRGLVLGVFSDGDGERYRQDLREIRELGATHVLVVVQHAMRDVRATKIGPRPWLTPSAERLDRVLAEARKLGLGLVLMPTLYLEEAGEGEWRGTIEPRSWTAWWASYESFIMRHARLAARHEAEVFCVGSELCSTETQRSRWGRLIARVRRTTPSLLTYSFNWDHLEQGDIADLLDVVGVNAYHDLSAAERPEAAELREAWGPVRDALSRWQQGHGRPLLFTEVGYRSTTHAALEPWNYLAEREYDGVAQARCYRAFLKAWEDHPALTGVFFYSWRGEGGPADTGYTPRDKPAEAVLRAWLSHPWPKRPPSGDTSRQIPVRAEPAPETIHAATPEPTPH